MAKIISRIGNSTYNKYGSKMTIVGYRNNKDIDVEFDNGYIAYNKYYNKFDKKEMKSPYCKSVHKIGYLGEGHYKTIVNGVRTKSYTSWNGMLERCSEKFQEEHPTYKGCTICEEWKNFQIYAKWHEENYYKVEGQRSEIDKDILVKGNKVYSPDTCVIVPKNINCLFTKSNRIRGEHPIGVTKRKDKKKYTSFCNDGHKDQNYLGDSDTPEEAFEVYKNHKEKLINDIADEYKEQIPHKLYIAMLNYEVEIID